MKKFLEFIWVLIGPAVLTIIAVVLGMLALTWIFTGCGILILLSPTDFPTPIWVRWFIGIFDSFCLVMIAYGAIREAYQEVYKS